MVYEEKCHAIQDRDIAEMFEMEAGRGDGCVLEESMDVHFQELYTDEEAHCLKLLHSLGVF